MLILLFIWIIELLVGVLQFFDFIPSNHYLYSMTGSFLNPAPYGLFNSICVSLFMTYRIKIKEEPNMPFVFKMVNRVSSVIIFIALIILPSTQSRSALLALGCSFFLLVLKSNRLRLKLKRVFLKHWTWIIVIVVTLGIVAYLYKKPSADSRIFIDKICINVMRNNGWRGAGLGKFGGVYGKTQHDYFKKQIDRYGIDDFDWSAINEHDRLTADCPGNAFNEYLFIGVEAGLWAMLLFIWIIMVAIIISFHRGTIWCYGLTAFAVFAFFSYPLHVREFQIMLPVLLAAALFDKNSIKRKNIEISILSIAIMALTIVTVKKAPVIKQYKQAETAWKEIEQLHIEKNYKYVVEGCDTLLPLMKLNQRFLFAYGQALNKTGDYVKSDLILNMGTEISSDPMFWNVMGNNSVALGRYREAEKCYKHAFYMVPNRLYSLYLLAKLYHTEGDTVRFMDMADRVETFVPKVESVTTKRLRAEIRKLKEEYIADF